MKTEAQLKELSKLKFFFFFLVLQESSPFEFRVILSDNTTPQDHCERWSTN